MQGDKLLSEILGYYKYKVDNNLCTPEEIKDAEKVLVENMEVYGSIKDFAEFYGVSEGNVRTTINRKMFAKPVRKILYSFTAFLKIIPSSWRKSRNP